MRWLHPPIGIEMRRPYYNTKDTDHAKPDAHALMPDVPHPAVSDQHCCYRNFLNASNRASSQMNVKRQRRQAAAAVVGSLWSSNNDTLEKKSTAQPRPQLHVPPRGIGPIVDPNKNDVLCGRGGRINSHAGNIRFRDIITANKKDYLAPSTKKLEKAHIAAKIVYDIRGLDPAGRFLKEDRDTGLWFDIGDAKAIKKTGQALREDAPDIRNELEGDSSGDEKTEKKESSKADKTPAISVSPTKFVSTRSQPPSDATTAAEAHRPTSVMWPKDNDTKSMMPPQNQPCNYQSNHQSNPYMQHTPSQAQVFEGRMIPIQMPHPDAIYTRSNQLASGVTTPGRRMVHASRHVMDALAFNQHGESNRRVAVDNEAFGRQFFEPANSALSGGGNTMSTLSGISDPISSTIGNSALMSDFGRESTLSGISGISALTGIDSARFSRRSVRGGGLAGLSGMGRSNRQQFLEAMKLTNSGRSFGPQSRSLSLENKSNMGMNIDDSAWRAAMESEEFMRELIGVPDAAMAIENPSDRLSVASGGWRPPHRESSSAMSIASMSTASSLRWLASIKDTAMGDDGRSVLSEMSADMLALDLALS